MPKVIAVVAAPSSGDRRTFRHELHRRFSPWLLGASGPAHLTLNLVDVEPPMGATGNERTWDAVLEIWLDDPAQYRHWAGRWLPDDAVGSAHAYHVSERVQLDRGREVEPGGRTVGIKVIYLVRRHQHLSDRDAAERWRRHAPLAREHHEGMSRYVQNGVIEPLTSGAPLVHGIAILHFPTRTDLEERMYGSAAGREAIAADAAGLVAESTTLYTSEYVLRA